MKKILAAMLSGAVVLAALGGCGTYTDDGTSSSGSSSSAETSSAESGTGESTDTSADTSADPMTFTFIGGQPVTLNPILSQSSTTATPSTSYSPASSATPLTGSRTRSARPTTSRTTG